MARISNERSTEIIDGNFEFASHYAGLGHFGLMRIKDSKAMHFISIRQTPMGEEGWGEQEKRKEAKWGGGGKPAARKENKISHD